jgi:hypothetical protein
MSKLKNYALAMLCLYLSVPLWGRDYHSFVGDDKNKQKTSKFRAACIEARAETDLDINNVRARLRSGGDLWWDGQQARYIVPNVDPASGQPEVSSLFAGGIWLGAYDDGGNLILAAQTYRRTGNDYWTGPLDPITAEIEKADCEKWDRFFEVSGEDIDDLRAAYFAEQAGEPTNYNPSRALRGWPGRGNPYFAEIYGFELPDQDLAPFVEPPGREDGIYDPADGDHPIIEVANCANDYFNPVYADQMIWWVYNDKGNIHTNTGGAAMSMEVQALAFSYQTTDAINNMTFYRYKLLNRNNLSLNNTYFSLWTDPDLGCHMDDYIGVDTTTGMGYVYNADENDESSCDGSIGYGSDAIPALGVDYFRGPKDSLGNEIGLSVFNYFENSSDPYVGNPASAIQHYRLMTGYWLDGTPVSYGGNGYNPGAAHNPYVFSSFPDETTPDAWSMCTEGITGNDYRFLHSSGPFVLKPGAVNELISGIVWVPEIADYPCPALNELVQADVLAQNLFDDCFKITDGPDAPYMDIIELENELVLNLNNVLGQNNFELNYEESPAALDGLADSLYRFQGYKIYQLASENISVTELDDPEKARLIYQTDLRDSIDKIVNWNAFEDPDVQAFIPEIMVEGANEGIQHSFQVKTDAFADKNPKLVNHRPYYFCVVAYAFNEYQKYDPTNNTGQAKPYLQGRKNFRIYTGIPRPNTPEFEGFVPNASYGARPEITRIDGKGNTGGLFLRFADPESDEATILTEGKIDQTTYAAGHGPIDVKVVDPLRIPASQFELYICDQDFAWVENPQTGILEPQAPNNNSIGSEQYWVLRDKNHPELRWTSFKPLSTDYEQYIPELGISLSIRNLTEAGTNGESALIGSEANYKEGQPFFKGIEDGELPFDYLKTGNAQDDEDLDPNEDFSSLVDGWHPVRLADGKVRTEEYYISTSEINNSLFGFYNTWRTLNRREILKNLRNVNVVITPDKTKWSRAIVVETANYYHSNDLGLNIPANYGQLYWKKNEVGRNQEGEADPANPGMSWFPGYAYDVETGERLNIFFGENSLYDGSFFSKGEFPKASTGNDMLFNPTDLTEIRANNMPLDDASAFLASVLGGQHMIYVANSNYDACATLVDIFENTAGALGPVHRMLKDELIWASILQMEEGFSMHNNYGNPQYDGHLPPAELTYELRVERPAEIYRAMESNEGYPLYEFDLSDLAPQKQELEAAQEALDLISVVPNPYYAHSDYEQTETDNVIKVTNLPANCQVNIYSIEGRLIRNYKIAQDYPDKIQNGISRLGEFGNPLAENQILTSLEWDLKNQSGVPVGSGVYLIHVLVPNVGERVVKSFIINRQLDAQKL